MRTEERGACKSILTSFVLPQVFSKNYRTVHGKPARTAVNAIFSLRDVTCDEVWKKVILENGKEAIVHVKWSECFPGLVFVELSSSYPLS
jgi:hypothetical protein